MISDFAKEKIFWTKKMNLNLVKFIQKRPNIWNPRHPKYTSVKYRDRTYAEFAANYGNEFTGQVVKDRWTNIRSSFSNYIRKIKASQAKGGEEYKVNWHLWEACQFLKNINRSVTIDGDYMMSNGDKDILVEEKNSENEDNFDYETCSDNNSTSPNISCKGVAENLMTLFKAIQNDAFGLDNSRYAKVGRTVTEKLSQMNSFEAARMTQQIVDILCLYDENYTMNPNNLKTESI